MKEKVEKEGVKTERSNAEIRRRLEIIYPPQSLLHLQLPPQHDMVMISLNEVHRVHMLSDCACSALEGKLGVPVIYRAGREAVYPPSTSRAYLGWTPLVRCPSILYIQLISTEVPKTC